MKKIKKEYSNKNILIVTHGGFMKVLHFAIKGYDENKDFLLFILKIVKFMIMIFNKLYNLTFNWQY